MQTIHHFYNQKVGEHLDQLKDVAKILVAVELQGFFFANRPVGLFFEHLEIQGRMTFYKKFINDWYINVFQTFYNLNFSLKVV